MPTITDVSGIDHVHFLSDVGRKVLQPHSHFYHILHKLWHYGAPCAPRGLKVKELVNFSYVLPPRVRFMCFDARGLKMDYVKQEFLWYLRGDPQDISIKYAAKMWEGLINKDGTINSNYGYYIFNTAYASKTFGDDVKSNFERVVAELVKDPDSRRATICILSNEHLNSETKDYPCTAYINFHIRNDELNMYVRMRSQDAIFGMGNDAPCFSFVHELMWSELLKHYPYLQMGNYYHTSDSFHVYERHYDMVNKILTEPYVSVDHHDTCPTMTTVELHHLRDGAMDLVTADEPITDFHRWLITREDPKTLIPRERSINI